MVTKEQFVNLSFTYQARVVWDEGKFVMGLTIESHAYILYALPNFFVEICISLKKREFVKFTTMDREDPRMAKFIEQIDIDKLMS